MSVASVDELLQLIRPHITKIPIFGKPLLQLKDLGDYLYIR
nr:unnamed protein product [Callosobruchus chinensis]